MATAERLAELGYVAQWPHLGPVRRGYDVFNQLRNCWTVEMRWPR
jgi:hypothetical protein